MRQRVPWAIRSVQIDGEIYDFDDQQDEFVESTVDTNAFLMRHSGSILVRVAKSQVGYLVSDGSVTLETLINILNALLYRAGRARLPPVAEEDASRILYDAARMCEGGVLELITY